MKNINFLLLKIIPWIITSVPVCLAQDSPCQYNITGNEIAYRGSGTRHSAKGPVSESPGDFHSREDIRTYRLSLPSGKNEHTFTVKTAKAGDASIVIDGLNKGGHVYMEINRNPVIPELLTDAVPMKTFATSARVNTKLNSGNNSVYVKEESGIQFVRKEGTQEWFAVVSEAGKNALLSYDVNKWKKEPADWNYFPGRIYYGPDDSLFLAFSGRFDEYPFGILYSSNCVPVGTSGHEEATLSFMVSNPTKNLEMPVSLSFRYNEQKDVAHVRVNQKIRATGPALLDSMGNLQFLHVVTGKGYGNDWLDGIPDFFWARQQKEDAPNMLPGSYFQFFRWDDNSPRRFPYPATTGRDPEIRMSSGHNTGVAYLFNAVNTVGGWFTKSGTGSAFIVFHKYEANFRNDLCPIHSNCGDGADTHFMVFWGDLFRPFKMNKGDELNIEYSLFCLPTEVMLTDIYDLNEADLFFFGKEKEQKSEIVSWLGTKDAFGLMRSDGSIILLGVKPGSSMIEIPQESLRNAKRIVQVFDLGRPQFRELKPIEGKVETKPGWFTVVDCGSVINTGE